MYENVWLSLWSTAGHRATTGLPPGCIHVLIVPFFVAFVVIVTVVISLVFLFSVYTRSFNYYIYRYILLHYKRVYFGGQCERKKKTCHLPSCCRCGSSPSPHSFSRSFMIHLSIIHSVVHSWFIFLSFIQSFIHDSSFYHSFSRSFMIHLSIIHSVVHSWFIFLSFIHYFIQPSTNHSIFYRAGTHFSSLLWAIYSSLLWDIYSSVRPPFVHIVIFLWFNHLAGVCTAIDSLSLPYSFIHFHFHHLAHNVCFPSVVHLCTQCIITSDHAGSVTLTCNHPFVVSSISCFSDVNF